MVVGGLTWERLGEFVDRRLGAFEWGTPEIQTETQIEVHIHPDGTVPSFSLVLSFFFFFFGSFVFSNGGSLGCIVSQLSRIKSGSPPLSFPFRFFFSMQLSLSHS